MSLTSFLKSNQDVRDRFRQEFPKPKLDADLVLLAPPRTENYMLVGTAFDYLLRFYLQRLNPNTIGKPWIAEIALRRIANDKKLAQKAAGIVVDAKDRVKTFLQTGHLNDELIASALLLAQLDPIYRQGLMPDNLGSLSDQDILDMKRLIEVVPSDIFKAKQLCLINPTFGRASNMVAGADADVVIDDAIIDIKTTKKLELQRRDYDQVVGYYVLHVIDAVGEMNPKPAINRLAIYFSRHAYLYVVDLRDIIGATSFPEFVQWFKIRAGEEYGDVMATNMKRATESRLKGKRTLIASKLRRVVRFKSMI